MNETTKFIFENALGKITFAYESDFWITEIDGLSSVDVDISESRSSNQVGASLASQSIQPRTIPIDGCIYEPLALNRDSLIGTVAPGIHSTLTVIDNGKSWFLDVVPTQTPNIAPGNGLQHFQMELYSPYPYWRSSEAVGAEIAGITKLFRFPFYTGGTWRISEYSNSFFKTVTNTGNVPIEFRVTFTARGELRNPELYHMGSRKRIKILKTMTTGERMVVSTIYGSRGIVNISAGGASSNGYKYLSKENRLDMAILPGENIFRIDAEENRENLGVRIDAPQGVRSGV